MAKLEHLQKLIGSRDTKANIEAGTSLTLEEQRIAYATDTGEFGVYTNGAWVWIGLTGQYRQFVWVDDGTGSWEFVSSGGQPVLNLEDLE
jgi:hypothetical protein